MDGDLAPLAQLAALAAEHEAMLLVDEAHATGLFGQRGTGLVEAAGLADEVPIRVGTLSKALGSAGGFVAGSRQLIGWLIQRARPYVFSTAHPAPVCAAATCALDVVRDEPWRRTALAERATMLRIRLRAEGWNTGAGASQIVPLILGDAGQTMRLAAAMLERGFWTPGIRPPSVPQGESLLRLSVTFGHTPEQIDQLVTALAAARASM
jgi:8-amino-7-oxononanoate synthase